jgi:hypothetical protein
MYFALLLEYYCCCYFCYWYIEWQWSTSSTQYLLHLFTAGHWSVLIQSCKPHSSVNKKLNGTIYHIHFECFAEMMFQEITQRGHCKIAPPNSPYMTNRIIDYGEKNVLSLCRTYRCCSMFPSASVSNTSNSVDQTEALSRLQWKG